MHGALEAVGATRRRQGITSGILTMIDVAEIRAGLHGGEFFLEYLPTYSLRDGRCIGAEALIRWRRPSGVVPPGEFIPVVERTPLIGLITYWVVETVAAELDDWFDANPDAHISINVPPELLGRGGVAYAAAKSGLDRHSSQVVMEITERGLPDYVGLESMKQLGVMGVRVALDDVTFVGGAHLAVLSRCPFDVIKLDKSVIDEIAVSGPNPGWLRSVSAMVESPPFFVIAEGVETEHQVTTLRTAGIHAAQGFYFSRPVSLEGLKALFSATLP